MYRRFLYIYQVCRFKLLFAFYTIRPSHLAKNQRFYDVASNAVNIMSVTIKYERSFHGKQW